MTPSLVPRLQSRRGAWDKARRSCIVTLSTSEFCSIAILVLSLIGRSYGGGCDWTAPSKPNGVWTLSGCSLVLGANQTEIADNGTGGLVTRAGREPLDWLPPGWQPPAGNASSALLHNLTLALPTCDTLWDLAAAECTFRASARWPTPGLQAGAAFLFYRSLQGLQSAAVAVNITCPPDLWAARLAASVFAVATASPANNNSSNNSSNSSNGNSTSGGGGWSSVYGGSPVPLAPCATATVTSGDELVAALAALQKSAARVLLTLAANVSLPATGGPTPMRLAVAPEDGLSLAARVYRNVTLVGGGSAAPYGARLLTAEYLTALAAAEAAAAAAAGGGGGSSSSLSALLGGAALGGTEVNFRQRRNGAYLSGRAAQASAGEVPGGAEGLRPVLTLAHVHIVNIPPGPPSSWPMGLMSTFHWWLGGTDKVGPLAPQLIALRCATTGTPAELSYQLGWYRLLVAVSRADRDEAAWMASWANPLLQVRSPEDGTITTYNQAGAFRAYYNTSVQTKVLLTTPGANEFDMWTDLPAVPPPAAALPNTTGAAAPAAAALLPPTAFAFANSTAELLALMQEPWVGTGSSAPYGRFIFLLRNMTLSAGDGLWPQGGAVLSYNVTLFGPTRGYPPVRLDTGSLPLVSAAAAPSASVVLVRFLRLQLAGSIVRALTAVPRAAVADAPPDTAVVLAATPELRAWRDRCLGSAAGNSTGGSSTGVATATGTGAAAVWQAEAYSSVLELPAASLVPLLAPTTPAAAAANATAAGGLSSQLQLPAGPASALVALAALSQPGAVVYPSVYNNSSSTGELLLRNGSLLLPGGNTTTSGGSSGSSRGSWLAAYGSSLLATPSASPSVGDGACDAGPLLMILQSLSDSQRGVQPQQDASQSPPPPPQGTAGGGSSSGGGGSSDVGAIVGGVVGGVVGVAVVAAALVVWLRARSKRQHMQQKDKDDIEKSTTAAVEKRVGGGGGGGGGSSGNGKAPHADSSPAASGGGVMSTANRSEDAASAATGTTHLLLTAEAPAAAGVAMAPPDAAAAKDEASVAAGAAAAAVVAAAAAAADVHTPQPLLPSSGRLVQVHSDDAGAHRQNHDQQLRLQHAAAGFQDGGVGVGVSGGGGDGAAMTGLTFSTFSSPPQEGLVPSFGGGGSLLPAVAAATAQHKQRQRTMAQQMRLEGGSGSDGGAASPSPPAAAGTETTQTAADLAQMIEEYTAAAAAGAANASSTSSGGPESGRGGGRPAPGAYAPPRVLGRGAFGVVVLGEWRGLPAAIKVMMFTAGDAKRAHRLAREVALTTSLSHPHVVPTYNYTLETLPADGGAPSVLGPAAIKSGGRREVAAAMAETLAADDPLAVVRLRLVMQYCEGGSLGAALKAGRFDQQQLPQLPWGGGPPLSAGAQAARTSPSTPPQGAAAAAGGPSSRQQSVRPAANMPLALVAALDVLSGLRYLHACNVVHGDLSENNILLKSVHAELSPTALRSAAAAAAAAAAATTTGEGKAAAAAAGTPAPEPTPAGQGMTAAAPPPSAASDISATAVVLQQQQATPPPPHVGSTTTTTTTTGGSDDECRLPPRSTTGPEQQAATLSTGGGNSGGGFSGGGCSAGPGAPPQSSNTSTTMSSVQQQQQASDAISSTAQLCSADGVGGGGGGGRGVGGGGGSSSCGPPHYSAAALTSTNSSMRASGLAAEGQWDEASLARAVRLLLGVKFKISDLGLSVQMTGDAQTHISNMRQGTPVFAAPELVASGRLAPAADMYSFGVVLWLLLHGVSLGQVSHLLPRSAIIPAHAALLRHSSPELPPAAAALLGDCLAPSPADRPTAAAARERVEHLLQEVLGPELAVLVTSGCERH